MNTTNVTNTTLEVVERLSKDLKSAAVTLSPNEARYLVDSYYQIQEYRKANANQYRSLASSGEPNSVIGWLYKQNETLEGQIKRALDSWTSGNPVGQWAKSIVGIGPVIAAGLLAHIDIEKAPTAGHIWRFAGLDPTVTWEKKTRRPWNAGLKVLRWKIGESFVKVCNLPDDYYGKVYQERKEQEIRKNDAGEFKEQTRLKLEKFNIDKKTDAYKAYAEGKLPPAHIHSRAKRYAVKLFLAHYQHVAYSIKYGYGPPKPYVIEHLGHVHYIKPPNWI